MGTLEEIKRMQSEGRTQQQITDVMKQQGVTDREIANSFSQAQIKDAVSQPQFQDAQSEQSAQPFMGGIQQPQFNASQNPVPTNVPQQQYSPPGTQSQYGSQPAVSQEAMSQGFEGMQPSMLTQPAQEQPLSEYQGYPETSNYAGGVYPEAEQDYSQYQPYEGAMSSDVITEIAEQIVDEKLSKLHDGIEKSLDFRNIAETKLESLNERLRRIEQIIDRLQISVLQKLGDYVSEVGDVKKELHETQKSFKKLGHSKNSKKK